MNAVITVATNFKQSQILRFVNTFRESNQTDKIIIIISNNDVEKHSSFIKNMKHVVDWFVVDDSYLSNKYYIISERFKFYIKILALYNFENVFLCDCRDIIFQGNIFKHNIQKLTLFCEEGNIEPEPFNRFTISYCNKNKYDLIKHNKIINAGTILGPQKDIVDLCHTIVSYIAVIPELKNEVGTPFNFDQAVLNIIGYEHPNVDIIPNCKIINTMGLSIAHKDINENGYFITRDGDICDVVHQFDRCTSDMICKIAKRNIPIDDLV